MEISGLDGRRAPGRSRRRRSLRPVVVVGFSVELRLVADLELGEEREGEGDGDFQLALMGQFGDLPIDVQTKAAAGLLAEGYERFHEVDPSKVVVRKSRSSNTAGTAKCTREAVATERNGEENPLGLRARAGPAVSCAALRLRTATLELPENAAFVALGRLSAALINRQIAIRPSGRFSVAFSPEWADTSCGVRLPTTTTGQSGGRTAERGGCRGGGGEREGRGVRGAPRTVPGPLDAGLERLRGARYLRMTARTRRCAAACLISVATLRTKAGLKAPIGVVVTKS